MANKKIYKIEDVMDRVIAGIDIISKPIAQTLSPKGGNVVYEDNRGDHHSSNDGFTIASNIQVKGDVENAIVEIVKGGSRKTNLEAGDGTSSTIVATSVLTKGGLKLVENGINQMDVRDTFIDFGKKLKTELEKSVVKLKGDEDVRKIALISASGDTDIADNVTKIIKVVGEDGQIIIDRGFNSSTEIIEDTGFLIRSGIPSQELANKQFQTNMEDVPVLITDKRLYYKSEAETILSTVMMAGYQEVVIIAQDFIGEALPYFIANHVNNKIRVILITEKKPEVLEDLAIFLGGEVVSDKKGSLVDNITIEDFVMAKRVFSDIHKSIISREGLEKTKAIKSRVKSIKEEMERVGNKQSGEYIDLQRRVSSLTNGMVTIKVGGQTPIEIMERIHRYEDAISAVRAAMKSGYLPGGGVSILNGFDKLKLNYSREFIQLFKDFAEVNLRQIVQNCGKSPDVILHMIREKNKDGFGFNATTGTITDMESHGIIEPYLVTSQVIDNAISIANIIITSRYIITNDVDDEDKK